MFLFVLSYIEKLKFLKAQLHRLKILWTLECDKITTLVAAAIS